MKVGILGATGAVGRQMIQCLQEREIDIEELRLFASAASEGKQIPYQGKMLTVHQMREDQLSGLDFVLGAVDAPLAEKWADAIVNANAIFIDNSKAFRMDPSVPLVVPEINGEDALEHHGIIANPNCSTIITMMAVAPIHRLSPVKKLIASTYQAVSGAGRKGIDELKSEIDALENGKQVHPSVFPSQIAFNCIPWIGSSSENGYTTEELKMRNEGRKILHAPDLQVTCTCVRVPVYRSHSISASLQCERAVSVEEAAEAIASFPSDVMVQDGYPMPLNASDQDLVYVGRLRPDEVFDGGLSLFCCGDQIRKGAASNAVQILQYVVSHS